MFAFVVGVIAHALVICGVAGPTQPPASPEPVKPQPVKPDAPAPAPVEQPVTYPAQDFPPITVKAPPKPAPGATFTTADELLVALEDADKGMTSLTAEISYEKFLATVGDRQTRLGKLYFQSAGGAEGGRRFAILFEVLIIGSRQDKDPQMYVFDGQWLLQKYPKDKRYTKSQVVPPGQKFDPLRIGEGPFPIPIGQKREDILARYNADLLTAAAGLDPGNKDQADLIPFVAGAYQLKLVPRADRTDRDRFKEIRLWYRAGRDGRLLPLMARTIEVSPEPDEDGNESLVRLLGVKVNAEIPAGVADTTTPPSADGWDGQVIDFREPAGK